MSEFTCDHCYYRKDTKNGPAVGVCIPQRPGQICSRPEGICMLATHYADKNIYSREKITAATGLLRDVKRSLPGLPNINRMKLNAVLDVLEYGGQDG